MGNTFLVGMLREEEEVGDFRFVREHIVKEIQKIAILDIISASCIIKVVNGIGNTAIATKTGFSSSSCTSLC